MKNLDVGHETNKKIQKSKEEIKKELDELIVSSEKHENTKIEERTKTWGCRNNYSRVLQHLSR